MADEEMYKEDEEYDGKDIRISRYANYQKHYRCLKIQKTKKNTTKKITYRCKNCEYWKSEYKNPILGICILTENQVKGKDEICQYFIKK